MTYWKTGLAAACLAALHVAPAAAFVSKNLILDGDGSAATCTDDWKAVATVPGWVVVQGDPTVNCSGIAQIDPPAGQAVPAAFIADGPWGDSGLEQTVNIASAATAIDAGGVGFALSGWLGGWAAYPGQAIVTAVFLDKSGNALGQPAVLDGATAAARQDLSRFLARKVDGTVPAGARTVKISLRFVDAGKTYNDGYATNLSFTLNTPVDVPTLAPPTAQIPQFDHVFLIMMENTDFDQVIGDTTDAPYINHLASQGTMLANYTGVYHPSDENYLAIAGGNTFVQGAIYFPNIHVPAPQIGDELEAAGMTWRAYEQGMGKPCNLKNNVDYYYEPDDAPFINFTDVAHDLRRCQAHLVDTRQLGLDLQSEAETPAFSWIAADDWYDGESSGNGSPKSLRTQDGWLQRTLAPIFNSPAWTKQRSLLVLTWDESDTYANNHVATILVGSQGLVRSGVVSHAAFNHYSTARTIEAALGIQPLTNNDLYAPPINVAFQAGTVTKPQLTLSSSSIAIGQSVTATYSTPPGTLSRTNWVGFYQPGQTPGVQSSTSWQYAPNASGSLSFSSSSLGIGSWDAYYFYNNGDTVLAGPLSLAVTSADARTSSALVHGCLGARDGRTVAPQAALPAHRRAGCGQ